MSNPLGMLDRPPGETIDRCKTPMKSLVHSDDGCTRSVPLEQNPGAKARPRVFTSNGVVVGVRSVESYDL